MKFEKLFYIALSSVIIAVFIFISNFTSSVNSPSSFVKKIYYVDNISAAHRRIINAFNKKYAGQIEVEAINLPFEKFSTNERKELLARYLRSKSDRIDIFSVDQIWVPRFAKWAAPFNDPVIREQKKELLSYATESCYYNDTLVAIPLYIDIALLYYREDMLKTLPDYRAVKDKIDNSITWEDFIELQKRLKKTGNNYFVFQAEDFEGLMCIFCELMAGLNRPLISNNKLQLNSPEALKALKLLVDLVNKYGISPPQVTYMKEDQSYEYYLNNNGCFLRGWPSFLSKDNQYLKLNTVAAENLTKAPTPHFFGYLPCSVYGGWNLMISKNSNKKPEVMKFINYLTSEESQKIMYEMGGYLPVNKNIYSDSAFVKNNPDLKFYKELLERGIHRPFLEEYTSISDVISHYLNAAIKKELTPGEALAKASAQLEFLNKSIK